MKKLVLSFFLLVATQFILQAQCNFSAPIINSISICQNQTIPSLVASTSETVDEWKWYQADGVTPITNNSATFESGVNNSVAGITTFYVSFLATDAVSTTQCESEKALVTVTVNPLPNATATSTSPICAGSTLNLSATSTPSAGATYAWTGPNGYTSTVQNPTIAITTVTSSGVYLLTSTVNGCTSIQASTTVVVAATPPAPTVMSLISYCSGTMATPLTATVLSGYSACWYTTATGGTSSSTAPTPSTTTAGTMNFWVSQKLIASPNCEGPRAMITVTVNPSLIPSITGNPGFSVCLGTPISLGVNVNGQITSYTWSGPASAQMGGGTALAAPTFSASALAGTYSLSVNVSDVNGCVGTATQTITINSKPFKLGDKDISSQIAQTTEIIVTDIIAPNTAKWYADESLKTLVNSGTSLQITDAVIQQKYYYVTQRNTEGCESEPALYTICSTSIPQVNFQTISIQLPETLPAINCTTTLGANEVISWIYNEDTIIGNSSFTPNIPIAGDYELFLEIKDTETGCVSDEFIIPITVNACLPLPTEISDTSFTIFLHEAIPPFEVQEPNNTWFDANYNQIGTGSTFTPLISRIGTFTFYAQQVNGTCVSKLKPFVVTVNSYKVSGKVFYDKNEDGIFQTTDVPAPNQMLYVAETQEYISTNSQGEYVWNTAAYGIYTISMVNKVTGVQVLGSDVATVVIDAQHVVVTGVNFRYKVNPINDISVDIYTSTPVVGRFFYNYLHIKNNGQKQYNVLVKCTFDNTKCSFISTTPQYLSQVANEVEFMLDSIEANSYKYMYVYLNVLPFSTLTGLPIKITVEANSTNVDLTPNNNKDSSFAIITNSFDPNDKAVTPSHLDEGYVLMNSTLQYKIRFQNKGTADAWDIYIKDTLDENLDITTFHVITASHDMHYTIEGRVVTFYFDNIMLPYEEADELGSNGFVVYEINPIADLPEETKVQNTAHIFFDFNPAVVTNTAKSTYVVTLPKGDEVGVTNVTEDVLLIAPNPVKTTTTITIADEGEKQIIITDASGKIIMQLSGSQTEFSINCSSLASGVYVCKVICNNSTYLEKIIVK